MALSSPSFIPPEAAKPVKIVVLEGHDLKGVKGDGPITFVRAEYNGVVLGDSLKAEATLDGNVKYHFTTSFDCHPEGPHFLDDIAHKPLLFTVTEVLPKEKKQKEEKTVVLGQAVMDLLPLLQGSCAFNATIPLYPIPGSPLETLRPDAKCGLDVAVSVQESLLSPIQLAEGNVLMVTMEAAYSVPEAFVPTGPQQNYMVGLQVPAVAEKECPFMFKNGTLKLGGEREPVPRPKKWPVGNILAPGAQNIPESFIVGGTYEEEDGELNTLEERDFRIQGETVKKRLVWDLERRCYLDPVAVGCLRKRIADCRCWPVEITRVPVAASTKVKGGKADKGGGGGGGGGGDDEPISFHGVAFVNLVPLLYPGVKRIRGAFRVVAYHDSEVYEKTKCLFSLFRDVGHQAALNKLGPVGMYTPHTKGILGKNMKEEKPVKEATRKVSTVVKPQPSEIAVETVVSVCQNLEGQQYSEAGTFIVMEFVLDKALVPKRLPEELASRVREMIPIRPQLPRRTAGAKKAVEDYHKQITSIAAAILDEYHELFGRQLAEGFAIDRETMEDQKCQLNYELNNSGKYFAFKEQLKHTVVKIVREKYLKTTAFDNVDQLQAFLSELYVYLVDQMHVALNQVLCQQSPSPPLPSFTTSEQLHLFAREAEVNGDYNLASTYYQERLSRDRQDIQSWLDYGAFCLLTEDNIKAQECFREAVALDPSNLPSLLLCGIMAVMLEHYEEAEVFFENATCLEPSSILAWTILGLFYDIQENDIRVEMAFHEASKLQKARLAKEKPLPDGAEGGGRKLVSPTVSGIPSIIACGEEQVSEETTDTSLRTQADTTETVITIRLPEDEMLPKHARTLSISSKTKMGHKEYIMRNAGLNESQVGIKIAGRNINNLRYADDTTLMAESEEELKSSLHAKKLKLAPSAGQTDVLPLSFSLSLKTELQSSSDGKALYPAKVAVPYDPEFSSAPNLQPTTTIFMEAIDFLMEVNALQFVHRALAHELLSFHGGPSCNYYLALAQTYLLKKEYDKMEDCLEMAVQIDFLNPNVWAQKGHLCYLTGDSAEAKACYERTISFVTDAKDMHFVYLRLGSIYLEGKEYDKAKNIYLLACKKSPSCLTWLGVGIACFRLKELAEAEDALSEANTLNNNNAEVWAYLALVCMQGGRQLEAEQSYKYAIKLELANKDLLQEIKEVQFAVGFGDPSF